MFTLINPRLVVLYFRDLDGARHIWYASTGDSYLVLQQKWRKRLILESTQEIYASLIPLERQMRYQRRVCSDHLLVLVALHALQYRCLMGSVDLHMQYARDICRRYFANRAGWMWPKLKVLVLKYYGRLEEYNAKGILFKRDHLTGAPMVTRADIQSQEVIVLNDSNAI